MKQVILEKTLPLQLLTVESDTNMFDVRNYEITFSLNTTIDETFDGDSVLEAQFQQNTSFTSIACLIEATLNKSIMFDIDNSDVNYQRFNDFENNFIILPECSDVMLCAALHCKFNSICTDLTTVHKVVLKDVCDGLAYSYDVDTFEEGYSELPTLQDWIGDLSYFDQSWWFRKDITTFDKAATSEEDLADWKLHYAEAEGPRKNVQMLEDIHASMTEIFYGKDGGDTTAIKKTGQLIEVDFKNKG